MKPLKCCIYISGPDLLICLLVMCSESQAYFNLITWKKKKCLKESQGLLVSSNISALELKKKSFSWSIFFPEFRQDQLRLVLSPENSLWKLANPLPAVYYHLILHFGDKCMISCLNKKVGKLVVSIAFLI